jgi:hypothetical protein
MIMSTTCSELNAPIIKKLLEGGYMALCPYTVGFVDACLLASDYQLLVNYFGVRLAEQVLRHLEEEEHYEECSLLKDCIDDFKNGVDYFY